MKIVNAILAPEAEVIFNQLEARAKSSKMEAVLVRGFHKKLALVKYNIQYGDKVERKLWPKEYVEKYTINNLFRVELPGFWRFTYTLKSGLSENEIVVLILDILDHDAYNKKFGYKGH
jgi:hypothetical protein